MKNARSSGLMVLPLVFSILSAPGCPNKIRTQTAAPEVGAFATELQKYADATKPLRTQADLKTPDGLSPEKQAEAVEKQRATLADKIRELRSGAKPGDMFAAETATHIKRRLDEALSGPGSAAIRDALEEQNDPEIYKGPPPAPVVNAVILSPLVPGVLRPDLPELPEKVEYRFAGRTLVLTDADCGIVLDYISNAFPESPPKGPETTVTAAAQTRKVPFLRMPRKARSVRFAVLGDTGTGDVNQAKVAETLWEFYSEDNRFRFVLLLGDNLYAGFEFADDYRRQFLTPYQKLLDARVKFRATLGNHDMVAQSNFKPFNMEGKQYYSFAEGNAKFVSLNSNEPTDPKQLEWLDKQFTNDAWRICFFHHPLYSSGTHARESDEMRRLLEERIIKNKVNVVFSGHEHFYERPKPQQNVHYFVSGAAAKLRLGDLRARDFTAFGYDREHSFMIVEIAGDQLFYQALASSGRTIDCGVIYRTSEAAGKAKGDETTEHWLQECDRSRSWLSSFATKTDEGTARSAEERPK